MNDDYQEFLEDLQRDSDSMQEPKLESFFRRYVELASENGDCPDLFYTHASKDLGAGRAAEISGYDINAESGELHLAISDFHDEEELQSLGKDGIDRLRKRALNFFRESVKGDFLNQWEETTPAYAAAFAIHDAADLIQRVRITIFSNAKLVARKKLVESDSEGSRTVSLNLLDFTRYTDILNSMSGSEPIQIDMAELPGGALPCLRADTGDTDYESYLAAVPGEMLAEIYGLYGARLLEQNVRTFLQATTKINAGIQRTIDNHPEMFFAYNNGLTATAAGIKTRELKDGGIAIETIENLQIVNGGQTTASILYAKDKRKADLSKVHVQMKLTVVDPELLEEVVPNISRFANYQNKITEADLASGSPFHIEMEKISRRKNAPQKAGALSSCKWFYERARGQYRDEQSKKTAAGKKKFLAEFPKENLIHKTDLAKYMMTFEGKPHTVSLGAQKCFHQFNTNIAEKWEADKGEQSFGEPYFQEAVAKALLFRHIDKAIGTSDWYKAQRGYKAQIVTYTLARFVTYLERDRRSHIDWNRIWTEQEPDPALVDAILEIAPRIAAFINESDPNVRNPSEYAKKELCWERIQDLPVTIQTDLGTSVIDAGEERQRKTESKQSSKMHAEVDFDVLILELQPRAEELLELGRKNNLLSPKSTNALKKMQKGSLKLVRSEKNALKHLLEKFEYNAIKIPGD